MSAPPSKVMDTGSSLERGACRWCGGQPAQRWSAYCPRDTTRLQVLYGTTAITAEELAAAPARWTARCAIPKGRKPAVGWLPEQPERDLDPATMLRRLEWLERERTRLTHENERLTRENVGLRAWLGDYA